MALYQVAGKFFAFRFSLISTLQNTTVPYRKL